MLLGEDLTRFRDASKVVYNFLKDRVWSPRVERLGFDEVFLDVSDEIDYNVELLNPHDLRHSFFHTSRLDPTLGFDFDARTWCGPTYPKGSVSDPSTQLPNHDVNSLHMRLLLGSHLAQHLRHALEAEHGYSSSVGISTSKLLSKLVGHVNKPRGQTTLIPPYSPTATEASNVTKFLDPHDISKIPGIGSSSGDKIRGHILGPPPDAQRDVGDGGLKQSISVHEVRCLPGMGPVLLERILGGPGMPQGIGARVWGLINGVDASEVALARRVPRQISIEDSYTRLTSLEHVRKELVLLSRSLLKRMHIDLTEEDSDLTSGQAHNDDDDDVAAGRIKVECEKRATRWIAYPKTLRLSTRPRHTVMPDGTKTRSFARISRTRPMPGFALRLAENMDAVAERLVTEALMPLFRVLHPQRTGWDLSLLNVAVTNMVETANDDKERRAGADRDIGKMFHRQEGVLSAWKVEDRDSPPRDAPRPGGVRVPDEPEQDSSLRGIHAEISDGPEDSTSCSDQDSLTQTRWSGPTSEVGSGSICNRCGTLIPPFALSAHDRFHAMDG